MTKRKFICEDCPPHPCILEHEEEYDDTPKKCPFGFDEFPEWKRVDDEKDET